MALCQRKPAVFADRFGAVFRKCCQDRGTVHGGRLCWCPQNPAISVQQQSTPQPTHLCLFGFAVINVVAVPVLRIARFRRFVRRHRDNCGRATGHIMASRVVCFSRLLAFPPITHNLTSVVMLQKKQGSKTWFCSRLFSLSMY